MKSLISSTLILLALYAQACCAQESPARLLMLNSQQQYFTEQISSIQPTLLISLQNPQYSVMLYSQISRHQSKNLEGSTQNYVNESTGLGIHHQVNSWMHTQIVVKSQQYQNRSSQIESMLSAVVRF